MENDVTKKIASLEENKDVAGLEEAKNEAKASFDGETVGLAEQAIARLNTRFEEITSPVETTEGQKARIESMGGSESGLQELTAPVDEKIAEKDAEIEIFEKEEEQEIGEVKNQTESKEVLKEELRETLAFLQKCEIIDKNVKEIGNFSSEAQALQRIKTVLEHNKNLEQAPQYISEMKDKFKDFLNDKVALMDRGYGKHNTLTSANKVFPEKREIIGHLGTDEELSKKFDALFDGYQNWHKSSPQKYEAGNIHGGTNEKNTFVLKDFLADMESYYNEERPIDLSPDEQNFSSKYQEAKKVIDSLPEDQRKEIETMQKKVLQENLKDKVAKDIESGKNLQYLKESIKNIDDFSTREDLTKKLEEKMKAKA